MLQRAMLLTLCLIGALAGLKAYDWYLMQTPPVVPDTETDRPTMRTAEVYPYTGVHMQPNMRERGNEVLWNRTYGDTYDVRSGDYGFWIDFPLDNPPPKAKDEVRIILTGGSGAQGWGGRTNEDMFYGLLPERLSRPGCKVSVINLAMGSTIIYQNFIALNKWGHALRPDAIVSFSGHNELVMPWASKSDDYGATAPAAALQRARTYAYSPAWLKGMAEYFPGIVKRTGFGNFVRYFYLGQYAADWQGAYRKAPDSASFLSVVEKISIPLYVHALESISRDFPKIPVFAVFQPLNAMPPEYVALKAGVTDRIAEGEQATGIHFYDMSEDWRRKNFYPGSLVDPVHLSNEGHKLVTNYLAALLDPFVAKACAQ